MKHSLALLQPEGFEGAWRRRRKEGNTNDDKAFEVGRTGVDIQTAWLSNTKLKVTESTASTYQYFQFYDRANVID